MGKKKSQITPEKQFTQDTINRRVAASTTERSQYFGGKKFNKARQEAEESGPVTPSKDGKENSIFQAKKIIEQEEINTPKPDHAKQKIVQFTPGERERAALNQVEEGKKRALEKQRNYHGSS